MMGSSPSSSARIDPRRGSNTIGGTKSDRSGGGTESLREETETQTSASTSAQSRSHGSSSTSRPRASPAELLRSHLTRRVPPMSTWSSAPVENSSWASNNFLLGAGMVVLQPSTMKVAIVYDSGRKTWFLPRGRKDIGESLEATALREAYEESGYQVEPLPLFTFSRQPAPPGKPDAGDIPNCEPIYVLTSYFRERRHRGGYVSPAGEYLTFWYAGQIGPDAVHHENTGMPDEANFQTFLVDQNEARVRLVSSESKIVEYAFALYKVTTEELQRQMETEMEKPEDSKLEF
ncbi:unnamed protein product [Mycena citricolor]|uniref:Nudix hydrolase domain-containing protein n=1 Tax=Mycena citricolor TaxID=2018698 RepID=A0AAD2HC86_9AGAR|nr:unnamed protein product [Mycena citricolor]